MHEGGMMLNYYRDYFARFPDIVAEDSEYVRWGNAIGGDGTELPPGWSSTGDYDDDTADDWQDALAGGIGALADAVRDRWGR